jgi:hypothetical protein
MSRGGKRWDIRVVDMAEHNGGDPYFMFKTVFYDERTNKPAHQEDLLQGAEDFDGLRKHVESMVKALSEPVLKEEDFKWKS